MERATQALLQADLVLAEQVITDHERITEVSKLAEEVFVILALQALRPVTCGRSSFHPDRRRCRPDGRAGPARRQDRPPPAPAARAA